MTRAQHYLRPDVQSEPLINGWYAWCHLVAPATAAFNIVERHLKAMASYVQAPALHAAAVRDPAMRGGPFLDLGAGRVEEVRALLELTRRRAAPHLAFTAAVRQLELLLRERGRGGSLEPLYPDVPDPLRGLVELYYDRHHRPDFRLFEPLLYRSPLYDTAIQEVALSRASRDGERPFVFATPRLGDDRTVRLRLPFASPALDALYRARSEPVALDALREQLGSALADEDAARFAELFTTQPPPPAEPYRGDGMRIRYFGHACLVFETATTTIVLDPLASYTYPALPPRFTYLDLPPRIDYLLISHGHHDHVLIEPLLQLRHKVGCVVVPRNIKGALHDPSLALMLRQLGFARVIELDELDRIEFPGGAITALPFLGEHHDLHVDSKLTYHVRHRERTALCMVDSCNLDGRLHDHIHAELGDIERLFVGMECDGAPMSWVYGPLLTSRLDRDHDRARRGRGSNCAEASAVVDRFACREVYVYAMGEEPWLRHILDVEYTDESNPRRQSDALIERCRARGLVAERLFAQKELQ